MPSVQLIEDPKVRAACSPLEALQQEVTKAYFALREDKEVMVEGSGNTVIDHKTTSGQTLGKIAAQYGVELKDVARTKNTKYLQIGEIVKVTKPGKKGKEAKFTKISEATGNSEVYIVVETKHLQGEKALINVKQGKAEVFGKKDSALPLQVDGEEKVKIEAVVGAFSKEEDITNKKDFEDWAIIKVTLAPKDQEKQKKWSEGLDKAEGNKTSLYLLVDVHSEYSMSDFKSEYVDYKGYVGTGDDSRVPNHFLNEEGAWFDVKKGCDCGSKDFDKQFQCTRYGSVYGPVYWGTMKLADYKHWDELIKDKKVTQEEKDILVGMSENEGKLDSVQSYDSEILTVGAMQKTVNPQGKGEFPIQVKEFKEKYPAKYKELFEDCGWTVENDTMYYKDPNDSAATKITGSALKTKIREGFKESEFKKKLKCAPLEPIAKASQDKDFQAKQVADFIDRLKNKVLPIKPSGYSYALSAFLKSKLGKATALDHHINRPGYVKTDFGKALDTFFAANPTVSKNPGEWGDKHAEYEKTILDDYGVNRRGTDMKGRYNKMKAKF